MKTEITPIDVNLTKKERFLINIIDKRGMNISNVSYWILKLSNTNDLIPFFAIQF